MDSIKPKKIDNIGNSYGSLFVFEKAGKYYWGFDTPGIEGENINRYEEIDAELYQALIAWEARRSTK